MSARTPHAPVLAAPRPLLDRLSDALVAMLDPVAPSAAPVVRDVPALGRYAAFDAPAYQRRGIRIPGLDAERAGVCDASGPRVTVAADSA